MSGRYRVEIARRAAKALAPLERRDQQRVRAAIDLLADDPRPPGYTKLAGEDHTCRVRTGDYRIVYDVFDDHLVIQVVRIGTGGTSTATDGTSTRRCGRAVGYGARR